MSDFIQFAPSKWQTRYIQARMVKDTTKSAWEQYKRFHIRRRNAATQRTLYSVSVVETDDMYPLLMNMMVESLDPESRRSLEVESRSKREKRDDNVTYELVIGLAGRFRSDLTLEGHKIRVSITHDEVDQSVNGSESKDGVFAAWEKELFSDGHINANSITPGNIQSDDDEKYHVQKYQPERIVFSCTSLTAREAVLRMLEEKAKSLEQHRDRPLRLYMSNGYGWRYRGLIQNRGIDSVILPAGATDGVVSDLEAFYQTEERYLHLGLPWHRGYLFYGPPGTGKTSLAKALANHFRLHVYIISLSTVDDDNKLLEMVQEIDRDEKVILVLEDIDIVHAATTRDDKQKGVTLAGLLNTLDGIATPHGLVTIMTTNNREALDSALVRPGRVDYEMNITYVTDDQVAAIVERFHGRPLDLPPVKCEITPAEIVEFFKDDLPDDVVTDRLSRYINDKNGAMHD